jgi:hypothetical protein
MRIFNTNCWYRFATYTVGSIIMLNWLAAFNLRFTLCKPLAFQWDKSVPGGHCGNGIRVYQCMAVPHIVTDIIMLVLPLPAVYQRHDDLGAKTGFFAIFLLGLRVSYLRVWTYAQTRLMKPSDIIICMLRLKTLIQASELFRDPTFNCIRTFTYTIAEAGTYLMAVCMPTLRPVKRYVFAHHSPSKKIGMYINKRYGSSDGYNSFGFRSHKRDIQLASIRKAASSHSDVGRTSTSRSNDDRVLKVDDRNVSVRFLKFELQGGGSVDVLVFSVCQK